MDGRSKITKAVEEDCAILSRTILRNVVAAVLMRGIRFKYSCWREDEEEEEEEEEKEEEEWGRKSED